MQRRRGSQFLDLQNHVNLLSMATIGRVLDTKPETLRWQEQIDLGKSLRQRFFAFLEQKDPLNPVLAGYFSRIFESFVNSKPLNLFRYIFEEHPQIIDNFKRHLYLRSIAEAFSKIITFQSENIGEIKY